MNQYEYILIYIKVLIINLNKNVLFLNILRVVRGNKQLLVIFQVYIFNNVNLLLLNSKYFDYSKNIKFCNYLLQLIIFRVILVFFFIFKKIFYVWYYVFEILFCFGFLVF